MFRYHEPVQGKKVQYFNIYLFLVTNAFIAHWVVQGATTQKKLVAPLRILVVQDNKTTVKF